MNAPLVILTGASGAGKTTIARAIENETPQLCDVVFFDSVGIPSVEEMVRDCGSIENWQRVTTIAWIEKIKKTLRAGRGVLFEGQTRLAFLQEALSMAQISNFHILLIDCTEEIRTKRLVDRKQPELANATMMNWATFLRKEAIRTGCEVIDTSEISLESSISCVTAYFQVDFEDGP